MVAAQVAMHSPFVPICHYPGAEDEVQRCASFVRGLASAEELHPRVLPQRAHHVRPRRVGLVAEGRGVNAWVMGVYVPSNDGRMRGCMLEHLPQLQLAMVWAVVDVKDMKVMVLGGEGGPHYFNAISTR